LKRVAAMRVAYDAFRRSGNPPGLPQGARRKPAGGSRARVDPLRRGPCARKRTQGSARGSASLLAGGWFSHLSVGLPSASRREPPRRGRRRWDLQWHCLRSATGHERPLGMRHPPCDFDFTVTNRQQTKVCYAVILILGRFDAHSK